MLGFCECARVEAFRDTRADYNCKTHIVCLFETECAHFCNYFWLTNNGLGSVSGLYYGDAKQRGTKHFRKWLQKKFDKHCGGHNSQHNACVEHSRGQQLLWYDHFFQSGWHVSAWLGSILNQPYFWRHVGSVMSYRVWNWLKLNHIFADMWGRSKAQSWNNHIFGDMWGSVMSYRVWNWL